MSTQVAPSQVERSRKYRSWTIIILTNVISITCMCFVLSGAGLTHIWSEVQHMRWRWVAAAIALDMCVYLLHGWRWKLMLAPIGRVPYMQAIEAIYVGLFANEVIPLRAGELIRCFLLS
ncbi:MAG: flippase-like domain-containing protein, partial [Acidobacteriaceae bacterium]|nr:flippase-like domain-containing protein [Acidobacteriaceae bacterium]